jgi:hypothetical protein
MNKSIVVAAVVAGLAAGAVAPSPARAADAREKQAAKLFYGGKYEQALNVYIDLAASTGNAVYVCEIGRCYQKLGKTDEAIGNLRDCLSQAKLAPTKRAAYRSMLAELEARKQPAAAPAAPAAPTAPAAAAATPAARTPAAAPPPAAASSPLAAGGVPAESPPGSPPVPPGYLQGTPAAPAPVAAPAPTPAAPLAAAAPAPAPAAAPGGPYAATPAPTPMLQPGQGAGAGPEASLAARPAAGGGRSNTAAYVIGGVGVAAAAGGVAFGLMARKTFDEVEKEFDADKEKTGKRYNLFQLVGYGVGAAGIGTAVVLLLSGGGADERAAGGRGLSVAVHPQGLSLSGRF